MEGCVSDHRSIDMQSHDTLQLFFREMLKADSCGPVVVEEANFELLFVLFMIVWVDDMPG